MQYVYKTSTSLFRKMMDKVISRSSILFCGGITVLAKDLLAHPRWHLTGKILGMAPHGNVDQVETLVYLRLLDQLRICLFLVHKY